MFNFILKQQVQIASVLLLKLHSKWFNKYLLFELEKNRYSFYWFRFYSHLLPLCSVYKTDCFIIIIFLKFESFDICEEKEEQAEFFSSPKLNLLAGWSDLSTGHYLRVLKSSFLLPAHKTKIVSISNQSFWIGNKNCITNNNSINDDDDDDANDENDDDDNGDNNNINN